MNQGETGTNERNDLSQDEILSSILQKLGGVAQSGASPPSSQGASADSASASASPTGDILSSLLSNPELIAKLPTIISSIKPIIEMLGKTSSSVNQSDTVPAVSLPIQSTSVGAGKSEQRPRQDHDSRTALLCAMKPYLSEDRRNAIDYIVKIGRLGDILKTL